jgi:hypothetical protein
VLLVDDWIETGGQASAVRSMVEECGGHWVEDRDDQVRPGGEVVVDRAGQTSPTRCALRLPASHRMHGRPPLTTVIPRG